MSNSSTAQIVQVPTSFLDSVGIELAKGTEAIELLRIEKEKTAKLKYEVDRKEGVIVAQINKNKGCYTMLDSARATDRLKDEIIATQGNTIKKLSTKPKRWSLGVGAGYGYAVMAKPMMQPVIYIGLSRTLFRF